MEFASATDVVFKSNMISENSKESGNSNISGMKSDGRSISGATAAASGARWE